LCQQSFTARRRGTAITDQAGSPVRVHVGKTTVPQDAQNSSAPCSPSAARRAGWGASFSPHLV